MEIEGRTPYKSNIFMITNTTSTPVKIKLPTSSAVYMNGETLPDLIPIENDRRQEEDEVNCIGISDDELTFMDDNVIAPDVQFLHEEPSQVFQFSPLNSASTEECGPLVNIIDCGIIEYTNISADLIEKLRNVHNVKGDGNCYFRCISYTLCGSEDYYNNVKEVLCNYIS